MSDVEVRTTSRRRRIGSWMALGLGILVVGVIGSAMSGLGQWTEREALDPESTAPLGTRALAEILRDQGVEVIVSRDRASASTALEEHDDATLVLPDAPALTDDAVEELGAAATDLVLIEPRSRDLRLFLPGTTLAGAADDTTVAPSCDLAEAERSGAVAPGTLFDPSAGATACYPTGQGWGLVVQDDGARRIVAIDARSLFVNELLSSDGNAALAMNLMGRHPVVVWYMPDLFDTDIEGTPSLGELTPPWVSPVIVVLLVAGVAAGIWRGRRFGPLVVERLPVTVRVGETTEGRARLYARAGDAAHAAAQLRAAALGRLGRRLGLGPAARADQIADAAATRTGLDRRAVHATLIDDTPAAGSDLVGLRTRIRDLEEAVDAALRPERNSR
ncbi:MAG: DUF4350 domain-containing protein [Microbacterium sp.]